MRRQNTAALGTFIGHYFIEESGQRHLTIRAKKASVAISLWYPSTVRVETAASAVQPGKAGQSPPMPKTEIIELRSIGQPRAAVPTWGQPWTPPWRLRRASILAWRAGQLRVLSRRAGSLLCLESRQGRSHIDEQRSVAGSCNTCPKLNCNLLTSRRPARFFPPLR